MSNEHGATPHITSNSHILKILALLLTLTAITVGVAVLDLGAWATFTALLVASIKVFFVLAHFMHLKHEPRVFRLMMAFVTVLFVAIIVVTFIDYWWR